MGSIHLNTSGSNPGTFQFLDIFFPGLGIISRPLQELLAGHLNTYGHYLGSITLLVVFCRYAIRYLRALLDDYFS